MGFVLPALAVTVTLSASPTLIVPPYSNRVPTIRLPGPGKRCDSTPAISATDGRALRGHTVVRRLTAFEMKCFDVARSERERLDVGDGTTCVTVTVSPTAISAYVRLL